MTNEQAAHAGYVLIDGEWYAPGHRRAVLYTDRPRPVTKLERDPGDGAMAAVQVQKGTGQNFYVRVTAVRRRLLDQDNLCEKYLVDLCRYAGVIPDDCPATTRIEVCQEKAEPGAEEEVRIEIYRI